ncbi:MAG: DUF87 domain-containing protein [Anaerolineales bacterium]
MHEKFSLGRVFDPTTHLSTGQPLHYDPDDLTTHAVVVGMTGSGKTGLCIDLLEEAALQDVPALMIDPTGDIRLGNPSRTPARPAECRALRCLYARLGCRHPGQHPGFPQGTSHSLGAEP